jgi:hypothetical protein
MKGGVKSAMKSAMKTHGLREAEGRLHAATASKDSAWTSLPRPSLGVYGGC